MIATPEPVVVHPAAILRRPAEPAPPPGPELQRLAARLRASCRLSGGAGLAAPQIGVGLRVALVDGHAVGHREPEILLVDPQIVESAGRQRGDEGCLSFPGMYASLVRPARVAVRTRDMDGGIRVVEASGLAARALCHELDHLDGILLPDRLGPVSRRLFLWRYSLRRAMAPAPARAPS